MNCKSKSTAPSIYSNQDKLYLKLCSVTICFLKSTLIDLCVDKSTNIYYFIFDISGEENTKSAKNTILVSDSSDSMYYSGYCYKLGDYIVPLNVALTDDKYAPQMMEEVFELLDADYDIEYGRGTVSWKYNGFCGYFQSESSG